MMKGTGPQNRLLPTVQRAPVRCPAPNIAGPAFCIPCSMVSSDNVALGPVAAVSRAELIIRITYCFAPGTQRARRKERDS